MADYHYDPRTGRYRAPDGRFVPDATVRVELDAYLERASARTTSLTSQLQSGAIDLAEWQDQVARELKALHVNAATLAHGGRAEMSPSDFGYVGSRIKLQYQWLRNFAREIAGGQQPLDGRLASRAQLYVEAARTTFENFRTRDARNSGQQQERWLLSPADHCTGCPAQAARGWVTLGQLPSIGSQPCRARCRCSKAYRAGRAAQDAA